MKILVLGSGGQLGKSIIKNLSRSFDVKGLSRTECDITHFKNIEKNVSAFEPDVIVNSAAFTAVDRCETEKNVALQANFYGVKNLCKIANKKNIFLIHFSTDYVYDGTAKGFISESHPTNPINFYGLTKLKADEYISQNLTKYLILRISWVYGKDGNNFLNTILKLLNENDEIKIVNDQHGIPTSTTFISKSVQKILNLWSQDSYIKYGIYNCVPDGSCTWYEFAKKIQEYAFATNLISTFKTKIEPISAREFKTSAIRPKNSKLCNMKIKSMFNLNTKKWYDLLKDELEK